MQMPRKIRMCLKPWLVQRLMQNMKISFFPTSGCKIRLSNGRGTVWKLRAPVDAFIHLGYLIGRRYLEQFEQVCQRVFSEIDSSLDLPEHERGYAGMKSK